jgi:hypothetical protein
LAQSERFEALSDFAHRYAVSEAKKEADAFRKIRLHQA